MHVKKHRIDKINLHFYVLLDFYCTTQNYFWNHFEMHNTKNNFCDPRKILHNTNFDMMHQITNGQFHARTHIAGY